MIRRLFILPVRFYQQTIGRIKPPCCRFYPTCSDYTIEALRKHGIVTGLWFSLKRICRCHPWNPGGVDPVPPAVAEAMADKEQKIENREYEKK